MGDSVRKLKNYALKGFLFHGSPASKLKRLTPKQATDAGNNKWNIDKAVFATDQPSAAVIFAIINLNKIKGSGTWSVNWENNEVITALPERWLNCIKKIKGYIYVVKQDTFKEKSHNQYKSKVSVVPIDKIEVSFNDYIEFGGMVKLT